MSWYAHIGVLELVTKVSTTAIWQLSAIKFQSFVTDAYAVDLVHLVKGMQGSAQYSCYGIGVECSARLDVLMVQVVSSRPSRTYFVQTRFSVM
jgi:hypothetical protein